MDEEIRLDSRISRKDLTSRECSAIIGGLLGALCGMADIANVRHAVRWWAERNEPWQVFEEFKRGAAK